MVFQSEIKHESPKKSLTFYTCTKINDYIFKIYETSFNINEYFIKLKIYII